MHHVLSFTVALLASLGLSATAFAHPGHAAEEPVSLLHYLAHPYHIAPLIGLAVLTLGVWIWKRQNSNDM